ncbi:MAG: hypothetical protein JRI51_11110 [Deltaproteobacteria bacterium]|nr:hypothetical protein [Deltaproteobacteria bacterium]
MTQDLSVWGAFGELFRTIGTRIRTKKWWKTVLWILWIVFSLVFLSAVLGSIAEYEYKAAWLYGIILLIILGTGIWASFRRDKVH